MRCARHSSEEIAQSIGVSRETVSRTLAELRENYLIRFTRGHIVLLEPEKLKSLVDAERTAKPSR